LLQKTTKSEKGEDKEINSNENIEHKSFSWLEWAKNKGHTEINKDKDAKRGKNYGFPGSKKEKDVEDKNRTYTLVMLRHGESEANKAGICSGWLDAPLTERGVKQAETAGKALRDANNLFDIAYTSMLCRAQLTCETALNEIGLLGKIPIVKTWRLNEAHYGGMTGLGTDEALDKYGHEVLMRWASTFNVKPPEITPDNPCYDDIVYNEMYDDIPDSEFPMCESLEDCMNRALVFWKATIIPQIIKGKRVIIVAHEDVLRGLMKHLNRQTDEAIMTLHLPNSIPFVYTLNAKMKPTKVIKFLGSPSVIANAYTYAHGYTDPRQSRGRAHPLDAPANKKQSKTRVELMGTFAGDRKISKEEAMKKKVRMPLMQSRIGQTFDNPTGSRVPALNASRIPALQINASKMASKRINRKK